MKYIVCLIYISTTLNLSAQVNTLYVQEDGKIGINTTDPEAELDVNGSAVIDQDIVVDTLFVNGDVNGTFNGLFSVGSIIMWSNKELPNDDWAICDGSYNSTYGGEVPNLVDRFIVGANERTKEGTNDGGRHDDKYYPFDTDAGKAKVELSKYFLHKHTHSLRYTHSSIRFDYKIKSYDNVDVIVQDEIEIEDSTFTDTAGDSKPINNIPPYYKLYFIIKIK